MNKLVKKSNRRNLKSTKKSNRKLNKKSNRKNLRNSKLNKKSNRKNLNKKGGVLEEKEGYDCLCIKKNELGAYATKYQFDADIYDLKTITGPLAEKPKQLEPEQTENLNNLNLEITAPPTSPVGSVYRTEYSTGGSRKSLRKNKSKKQPNLKKKLNKKGSGLKDDDRFKFCKCKSGTGNFSKKISITNCDCKNVEYANDIINKENFKTSRSYNLFKSSVLRLLPDLNKKEIELLDDPRANAPIAKPITKQEPPVIIDPSQSGQSL